MHPHRTRLLSLLDDYNLRFPGEAATVDRIRRLVLQHHDCLERTCRVGHVTASAFVVDPAGRYLLTHHKKLGRWLQVGGHADGDLPETAARREAEEESGIAGLEFVGPAAADGSPIPFDLDVHVIPARGDEPQHEHHDVRYLLRAPADAVPRAAEAESHGVAWFTVADVDERLAGEESLHRMWRKAAALGLVESRA